MESHCNNKYSSFIATKYHYSWHNPQRLRHLSHLVTGSKIQSRQKSGCCISNYLQTTTSTSSLLWNQQSPKYCISSKKTWLDGPAVANDMTANCAVWGCTVMLKDHTLQQIISFGHWSSTWEVTVSTIMRKWTLTFVNGCECNSLTSDMMNFLNSWQDGRNAWAFLPSWHECAQNYLEKQWYFSESTLSIQITCHLLLQTRNRQLLSTLQNILITEVLN